MNREEVEDYLLDVRAARAEYSRRVTEFRANMDSILTRLLYEAARNYMSVQDVSAKSGIPARDLRKRMRALGMDPKRGKTLLAKTAADALRENAALLGIEPSEMDPMSPLMYLPMGKELRDRIVKAGVSQVHELPEEL